MSMKARVQQLESQQYTLITAMALMADRTDGVELLIETFVDMIWDLERPRPSKPVFLSDTD